MSHKFVDEVGSLIQVEPVVPIAPQILTFEELSCCFLDSKTDRAMTEDCSLNKSADTAGNVHVADSESCNSELCSA